MSDKLISVIIPVYNTERYLADCLKSIVNQTYKNIEIIVVDNVSIDRSVAIAEEFKKNDNRIKIIKNASTHSAGYSRNVGFANSTGEYIWFIDSDDVAEPTFLEVMAKKLSENENINIVQCCYTSFGEFGFFSDYLPFNETKFFTGKELCKIMNEFIGLCGPNTMIWNKLYRRRIWEENHFYENVYYEDMYLTYKILYNEPQVLWIKDRLMNWRKRISSDTALTNYSKMCIHELYAYIERADFYLSKGETELYDLTIKRMYYIATQHLYLTRHILNDDEKEKRIGIIKHILKCAYIELKKMDCWSVRTRLRMRFIHLFPVAFGRTSLKRKLDFTI